LPEAELRFPINSFYVFTEVQGMFVIIPENKEATTNVKIIIWDSLMGLFLKKAKTLGGVLIGKNFRSG